MNQVTMELYKYDKLLLKAAEYDSQKEQIEILKEEKAKLREEIELLKARKVNLPDKVQIQNTPYGQEIMLCGKRIEIENPKPKVFTSEEVREILNKARSTV